MSKIYDYASEALDALREHGFILDRVEFDGVERRCATKDKPEKENGAYRGELSGGLASVVFYNHRTKEGGCWYPKRKKKFTDAERRELERRVDEARKEREAERAKTQKKAAKEARKLYDAAKKCKSHPYLKKKGVRPVKGLKIDADGKLLIPMYDSDGTLMSLQFIDAQSRKRFLPGGKITGTSFLIGDLKND